MHKKSKSDIQTHTQTRKNLADIAKVKQSDGKKAPLDERQQGKGGKKT